MSIQSMTRQALFRKMAEVVSNLPNEDLPKLWQQLAAWEAMIAQADTDKSAHSSTEVHQEVIEFVVAPRLGTQQPFLRLPIRTTTPVSAAIMEVGAVADAAIREMDQLQANILWWNQHFAQIWRDATLYNRYVAIANGELFTADTYADAYQNALQVHPDSLPYIFFRKSPQEVTVQAN
jgi:hypothetical protein